MVNFSDSIEKVKTRNLFKNYYASFFKEGFVQNIILDFNKVEEASDGKGRKHHNFKFKFIPLSISYLEETISNDIVFLDLYFPQFSFLKMFIESKKEHLLQEYKESKKSVRIEFIKINNWTYKLLKLQEDFEI